MKSPDHEISNRQHQILVMIANGQKSLDIAGQLGLSVHTVNNHRKNMLKRTGCSNSTELIMWGVKRGLIP